MKGSGIEKTEFDSLLSRVAGTGIVPPSARREQAVPGENQAPGGSNQPLTAAMIENRLAEQVLHQPDVTSKIAQVLSIRSGPARLHNGHPRGMFLAVGPTGTGKTTLGEAIARVMPGYDNLIRIDCSELATSGSTTRLVGASHGYIGFDNRAGLLTTKVRKKRRSVLLFDEIEKAHPDIHHLFLQIAEGRLTDGTGATTDFSDTICIATSNVGAREMTRRVPGFANDDSREKNVVSTALQSTFSPELLGRFDAILEFGHLPEGAQVDIAWKTWKQFRDHMAVDGWELDMDRGLLSAVVGDVFLHDKGARELERRIEFDVLADLNNHPVGSYTAVLEHSQVVWR